MTVVRRILARRILAILAVAALLLVAPAGGPWAQSSPRGADHDGYGRMVFDWDGPVQWSAEAAGGKLVVKFERPMAGDPKVLLKPLSKYLKGVVLAPDRKTATFTLARPVEVKTFLTGSSVVVDLSEAQPAKAAAPPQQAKQVAPQAKQVAPQAKPAAPAVAAPATPATPAAPAATQTAAEPPVDLMVRGGEHTGFNRLVFDWGKPVGYAVDQSGAQVVISFDRAATVNVVSLKAALPADVAFLEARPAGKGTAVVLSLPEGMRARHFTSGPKVAVDLVRPAGAPPPPRAAGAAAPPLAPAPGSDEQPPALKPLSPLDPPVIPPIEVLTKAQTPAKAAAAEEAKPIPKGKTVSLGFPFDKPTAAAVFRRAGYLWAVFDHKVDFDTKLLKRSGGEVVSHVEQVPLAKGVAVRLITRPGYNPSLRKEGQLWVLDLSEMPMAPKVGLEVNQQFDFEDRGRIVVNVTEASPTIALRDPEVGDAIQVVPILGIGAGVRQEREFPALEMLSTAQGVVVIPKADGVRLDVTKSGVEIGMAGGMPMSREALPGAEAGAPVAAQTTISGPLDIGRWLRGGPDKFYEEHQKLMRRLAQVKPEDRNAQRLEVARHYLANGFGAEALGVLQAIAGSDPAQVDAPAFRAVRGAANFLMFRDAAAIADLSVPSLSTDANAGLFLAAAKARTEPEPGKHLLALRLAGEDIKGWPRAFRMGIGSVAARTVANAGDTKAAARILDAMQGPGLSTRDKGTLAYLGGIVNAAAKQYDTAIAKFREAEEGESRPDRAFAARDRIELMLKLGKMTPGEAVRELERLRFAWRGEDYEYRLLKRLGELLIAAGRYGDGLRALRTVVSNYGEHPDVGTVATIMSDAFNRLYLDGEADRLSAIVAIGLYDEFQELTPSGTRGDEMIRRLADRLAAVDLLDRSAELLRHQVNFRLSGTDKVRVGTRLAFLDLSDRRPQAALDSLDSSEMPNIPGELVSQRRYMRVQALDDLGRSAEALALIINDQADEAKRLRAEIYWRLKKWPEAAAALETLIEPPSPARPLTPQQARRVVDLATALTLAKDERGLQRLRRGWSPHMAATEYKDAFALLTSEPERGIIDYRRVPEKIKQVQDFQTFMGEWRKKVRTEGLSSIN